jgi:hypothetical protein
MLFLIFENAIAGTTNQTEGLPAGFSVAEGPDAPNEELYWDGSAIVYKPPRPTPSSVWNTHSNQWEEFAVPQQIVTLPDWKGLELALTGTQAFGRAFNTAPANAWTLLLSTITTMHNIDHLMFALNAIRQGMPEDFNSAEIEQINQALEANNFDFKIQ